MENIWKHTHNNATRDCPSTVVVMFFLLTPGLLKTHNTECIPASFLLWLVTQIDIEENFGGGLLMCPAVLFLALIQTLGQSFSFFYFNQDRFCSL
jgi:hypothetical protein